MFIASECHFLFYLVSRLHRLASISPHISSVFQHVLKFLADRHFFFFCSYFDANQPWSNSQLLLHRMLQTLAFANLAAHVAGHGWLVDPISKIELVSRMRDYQNWQNGMPEEFRYCPDCSANGNNGAGHFDTPEANCGASSPVTAQGLSAWQPWYDAGGVAVPVVTPGSDMKVEVTLTADHGGEFWFMLSCDTQVSQSTNWTIL